jgi:uncharacterized protein
LADRKISVISRTRITIDYDVPVRMTDGAILLADVLRPGLSGRYPVILVRTPYGKLAMPTADTLAAVRAGYVVVIQDVRGSPSSHHPFRPFAHEAEDGAVSIEWAASQEWSNGAVGMAGGSYVGATQLLAAIRSPPALRVIAPDITPAEYYNGWAYEGGAFQLAFALSWSTRMAHSELLRREQLGEDMSIERSVIEPIMEDPWSAFNQLPLMELPRSTPLLATYCDWLCHPDRDEFWRRTAINEHYHLITVPALHIAGWNDVFLRGSLENYVELRAGAGSDHARANQRLIVTPWGHAPPNEFVGDILFGAAANPATVDVNSSQLEFFGMFLKGEQDIGRAPVRIFVMGANYWRDEDEWPLARAVETRFYLGVGGRLTRVAPRDERPDEFVYDPHDPFPTVGGNTLLPGGGYFMGPRDRRSVQRRPDLRAFTSDVLPDDVEVTGPVIARLHVSTSAVDTDFTATLVDVYPDGRLIGLADGILRLRYREGLGAQHFATPGEVNEIEIDLAATSNVFRAGHRIRIEISSSNFPRFDRNPNNGGVIAEATERDFVVATQRIFHDTNRSSYITLPVIPR